jgi:hypothetical protein
MNAKEKTVKELQETNVRNIVTQAVRYVEAAQRLTNFDASPRPEAPSDPRYWKGIRHDLVGKVLQAEVNLKWAVEEASAASGCDLSYLDGYVTEAGELGGGRLVLTPRAE